MGGCKVDEQGMGYKEEEEAERERKLTIRQREEAEDERIKGGSTGSKEEVKRERHEKRKRPLS